MARAQHTMYGVLSIRPLSGRTHFSLIINHIKHIQIELNLSLLGAVRLLEQLQRHKYTKAKVTMKYTVDSQFNLNSTLVLIGPTSRYLVYTVRENDVGCLPTDPQPRNQPRPGSNLVVTQSLTVSHHFDEASASSSRQLQGFWIYSLSWELLNYLALNLYLVLR